MSYLPNIITIFRIAMAPLLILLLRDQNHQLAFYVFILAGISDGLDGYIAKRFGYTSQLGAILDPLADKLLVVSAYVMLTLHGQLPFWLMLTVAFRDLLIVGGYLIYVILHGSVQMQPSYLSKVNTFLQISLVVLVLAMHGFHLPLAWLVQGLVLAVFATTVASGAHYMWVWVVRKEVVRQSP